MNLSFFASEIWRTSWQAAALVGVIGIAQWLCGMRLPPRWRYNLWLVVVVRLLLPFSPESSLSLFNLVHVQSVARVAEVSPFVEPIRPSPQNAGSVQSSAPDAAASPSAPASMAEAAPPAVSPERLLPSPPVPTPIHWDLSRSQILIGLWLIGMAILGTHVGWRTVRTFRQARRAAVVDDPEVLTLMGECQRQMGLRVPLRICETPMLQSPALFGLFRPVLLLPPGFTKGFSPAELRHVFLHELAHVVRRDLVWNWLLTLLQIVHWFNPAIWFGFARMRADRELACDALALSRSGAGEARTYGATIIKLLETLARPAGSTSLVGILENRNQMVRRIRMIAAFHPGGRWSLLALVLMAALILTGLTDAVRTAHAQEVASKPPADSGVTTRVKVVDAATGLPIAGVPIYTPFSDNIVFDEAPKPLVTDREGAVAVPRENLNRGMGILASHADYAPAVLTWSWYRSSSLPARPTPVIPEECTIALERGSSIGGVARDDEGRPVAGARVSIEGVTQPLRDTDDTTAMQYPTYRALFSPTTFTDAEGRWSCPHFPSTIEYLQLDFIRPDGSTARFHSPQTAGIASPGGEVFPLEDARRGALATVLKRGITVRGIVRDADGKPVPGIAVTESDRRHPQPGFVLKTDAEGRFELRNRDPHQILLTITAPGRATVAEVLDLVPEMPEVELRVLAALPLALRVTDEAGQPLADAGVQPVDLKLGWFGKSDAEGRLKWEVAPRTPLEYQFFANGYRSLKRALAATEGEQIVVLQKGEDQQEEFETKPSAQDPGPKLPGFEATLTLSDGRPAGGATVAVQDLAEKNSPWINVAIFFGGKPSIDRREDQKPLRADASGRLTLPVLSSNAKLIMVHEDGFLVTTAAALQQHPEIHLAAWGSVEGTLTINGQPRANERLHLRATRETFPDNVDFSNAVTTDATGRFKFERAPAGSLTIFRTQASDGEWPQSNDRRVEVTAGQTTRVAYEITGRTVTGKVKISPADADFDWKKNGGTFLLKRIRTDDTGPAYQDFVRYADYRRATNQWQHSLQRASRDTYGGVVEADGSFRIDAVPPGNFDLVVEAYAEKENRQRVEIGSLRRPLTVAAGAMQEAQSLGTIDFPVKAELLPKRAEIGFSAQDFEGHPVRLADFRGKVVLLNFCANWAPPSAQKAAFLKTLYESYKTHPHFVFLNISLDDSADAARKFMEAQKLPGLQTRLEGRAKVTVTEALAIDELPAILLMGPDGRLLARDLPEARWSATINSLLNP